MAEAADRVLEAQQRRLGLVLDLGVRRLARSVRISPEHLVDDTDDCDAGTPRATDSGTSILASAVCGGALAALAPLRMALGGGSLACALPTMRFDCGSASACQNPDAIGHRGECPPEPPPRPGAETQEHNGHGSADDESRSHFAEPISTPEIVNAA
jgi:hypothetical protein